MKEVDRNLLTPEQLIYYDQALRDQKSGMRVEFETVYDNGFTGLLDKIEYRRKNNYCCERDGGPAWISWHKNGQMSNRSYKKSLGFHREDGGPAQQSWYENGQIHTECYRIDDHDHRDYLDGPAVTVWHENGQIQEQEYAWEGQLHRDPLIGPARSTWKEDGTLVKEAYFWKGEEVEKGYVPPPPPIHGGLGRIFV